jgi:hypothetical protein
LEGFYVVGIREYEEAERWCLICADDPPVRRIRTFPEFYGARRFLSSLVLRGIVSKMKMFKGSDISAGIT